MSQWLSCILTTYKKRFVPFTTPIINICDWPLEFTWLENLNLNFSSMLELFNWDCDLKAQQNFIQIYVLNAFGPNTSRTSGHESKTVLCFCCDCLLNELWKGFVKFIMAYSRQINIADRCWMVLNWYGGIIDLLRQCTPCLFVNKRSTKRSWSLKEDQYYI